MLLLTNALIVDGSGNTPYTGSILLREGRVEAVGAIEAPPDTDIIDLDGAALSPGFIDLHSHSDLKVLENRREKSDQGITSEVVGNCGFSPYPCGHHKALLAEQQEGILNGDESWPTARAYLDAVKQHARLVHVESLIGHGALRTAICGKQANSTELIHLDTLTATLDEALSEGAIGFSTGLMYAPGSQAPFAELEALCRVVARHNKLYTSHIRSYAWQLIESIDEQIELARRTGCRLQISHLQTVGRDNWHKQPLALEKIEQAHAEGIDIGFDCYPYLAGSTVMTQLLPQTALAGGLSGMLALIASPSSRAELEASLNTETAQGWDDIFVSSLHTQSNRPLIGQHVAAIAEARGTTPAATILDLLAEESGRVNIVSFNQSEPNLQALLTHPLASIITDGFYVSERPHPRLAGAFPTFLGEFVRNRNWLSLQEAVRKITTAPAARLGLTDRGNLTPGSIADLTIFDATRIGSDATFDSPTLPPTGIHLVIKGQSLMPKSSSLLDEHGILSSRMPLAHATVTAPGELHYAL
jgi:N-acyl-D-amino-acid deacylase